MCEMDLSGMLLLESMCEEWILFACDCMSFEYAWYIQLQKWSAFFFFKLGLAHPPLVGMRGFIHAMLHIHICSIAGGLPWSPETGAGWHPGQRAGEGHILLCAWTREDDMADNAVDQIKVQQ